MRNVYETTFWPPDKCYPHSFSSFHSQFVKRVHQLRLPESFFTFCSGDTLQCMKDWMSKSLSKYSIKRLCPFCQPPCHKKKYHVQSTSWYSKRNLRQKLFKNVTYNGFRKIIYLFVFIFHWTIWMWNWLKKVQRSKCYMLCFT